MSSDARYRREEIIDSACKITGWLVGALYDRLAGPGATVSGEPAGLPGKLEERLLTREDAARELKVSVPTIDRKVKAGTLRPVEDLRPIIRFTRSEVDRMKR